MLVVLVAASVLGCGERSETQTPRTAERSATQHAMDIHECVTNGSLEALRRALEQGADVNSHGRNGATLLMAAIAAKDIDKMQLLLDRGADPEVTDDFNATALGHAVDWDFVGGVRLLLELNVDRGYSPKYPLKKVDYSFATPEALLPAGFRGLITEEEWRASLESQRDAVIKHSQNPSAEPIIERIQSVDVLKLFLAAGDDLQLAPGEVKRAFVGLDEDGEFQSSAKDYEAYRAPRFGNANPERMGNPLWNDMVRLGGSAYSARDHFNDTDSLESVVWSYDRFGSSLTPLPDGRFIQIAGEHEDFYDPDFYIYNDVVVHDGHGGLEILGYPRGVFPPTDFHTATLAVDSIYIIGCLGYTDDRKVGATPVYRLAVGTWKIEVVTTSGDTPSWLHEHRATYDSQQGVIRIEGGSILVRGEDSEPQIVPNSDRYELDLETLSWRRLS